MGYVKKSIAAVLMTTMVLSAASCSIFDNKFATTQTYSAIKDDAYKSKSDIDKDDEGIYMKTVAGVIKYLDKGDADGLSKLCCDGLLDMDGTDDELEAMADGFEGKVTDTTPIGTDLGSRGFAQWSGSEPVACYDGWCYIYTDEQTYYLRISMCSVNKKDDDGDDSVGVCMIELMTIDMKYDLERTGVPEEEDVPEYVATYVFGDGSSEDVPFRLVGMNYCGIVSAFGDCEGYTIIDTAIGYSYNVYKLTGTDEEIDLDDVKDLDMDDPEEMYEFFAEYEQYAVEENDGYNYFYNIEGKDDEKLLVWVYGTHGDDDVPYVAGIQVMDITKPYNDQKREEIYNSKNKS